MNCAAPLLFAENGGLARTMADEVAALRGSDPEAHAELRRAVAAVILLRREHGPTETAQGHG